MAVRIALFLCVLSSAASAQSIIVGSGASDESSNGTDVVVLVTSVGGIEVQSGGTLQANGKSGTLDARFTGPASGVPISVLSGGTIDLQFARIENVTTLSVAAAAKFRRCHDVTFTDSGWTPGTLPWIDISGMASTDRNNLAFSFNRVTFADTQATPARVNVKAGANTPLLRMLGQTYTHGNRWGESFDDDVSERVRWDSNAVQRSDGGSFHTIHDALNSSSTLTTHTITVTLGPNAFIDESIDFEGKKGAIDITGPTIRNACLAPIVGPAVQDSDAASGRRAKFYNCVFARGDVRETTLQFATIFNADTGITVDECNVGRTLVGSGVTFTANNVGSDENLLTATSAFFVASSAYNFYLVSPGGNAAIDEAPALPGETDWEGHSRGVGGKVGGST